MPRKINGIFDWFLDTGSCLPAVLCLADVDAGRSHERLLTEVNSMKSLESLFRRFAEEHSEMRLRHWMSWTFRRQPRS
jgi:hypothetical protein